VVAAKKISSEKYILLALFIAIIIAYFIFDSIFDFSRYYNVEHIGMYIDKAGLWGPFLFIITMALAIIISPIPSLPLDAAAGAVWGPYVATVYAVIGAEIGAIVAFIIARRVGRGVIETHFRRQIIFCYNCSQTYLFVLVFVSRLFPFFQFDIVSYGAGLTDMKLRNFAIATFFGMIPMTFLFAKLGESFVVGSFLTILATGLIIAGLFVMPILIQKYNFLWLKSKISIRKK